MRFSSAYQNKKWPDVHSAKILVTITFHYAEDRLKYLHTVIAEIFSFPVTSCIVHIFTNIAELQPLETALESFAFGRYKIFSASNLQHPFDLAWSHKSAIPWFIDQDDGFTHFIYLEDDERLSFASFCYFVQAREALREHGLFPSFARTEWSENRHCFMSADNLTPNDLGTRPYVACGDVNFVALDQPYCGLYIFDRQLAKEHLQTRSFDKDASIEVSCWHTRERAAMGLMFENRPSGFEARGVVPVDVQSRKLRMAATVAHLPSNYADNPCHPSAKLPLAHLFDGEFSEEKAIRPRYTSVRKRRGLLGWIIGNFEAPV